MMRSLSGRLATMFAACSAVVFLVGGVLLYVSLRDALERQLRDELELRASLIEGSIVKASDEAQWVAWIRPKLEAVASANAGTVMWVESGNSAFAFGSAPAGLAGQVRQAEGFSKVKLIDHDCAIVTFVHPIAARGDRPALRLILATDPTPFMNTLAHFRYALALAVVGGVGLVGLMGYWVSRFGLKPLARLSTQARALRPGDRSKRLAFEPMPGELVELTASFNGALERLERACKQLEAFNADVAHELRTPLMNLICQTQVVLSRPREAGTLEEVMQSNLEELERMRAIVNDMLFLARADQGALAHNVVRASLAEEVTKVCEFLEPLIEEGNLDVEIVGDERVAIERALFHRAVSNLLHNAIQHTERGQTIRVRVERHDGVAGVSVCNPGGEIESVHLPHLFDRFYRADSSRANSGENHGLGLSIVKAIATMHEGNVFARSTAGWNTFGFTVALIGTRVE